jgi:hypothetical protein
MSDQSAVEAAREAADLLEQVCDRNVPMVNREEREAERRLIKRVRALPASPPTAVQEFAAKVEQAQKEALNETMIGLQGSIAEDRCEVLHAEEYARDESVCVECTEHAADLLHDGWDEKTLRIVRDFAAEAAREVGDVVDAAHLEHQREWSAATFGPSDARGPAGPLAHLRKEIEEVAEDPFVLEEWVDCIILAFDGAWRAGHEPAQILAAIKAKQAKNEARVWPDWRDIPADQAIEHVRVAAREVGGDEYTKPWTARLIGGPHNDARVDADLPDDVIFVGTGRVRYEATTDPDTGKRAFVWAETGGDAGLRARVKAALAYTSERGVSCGGLSIDAEGCYAGDLAARIRAALAPAADTEAGQTEGGEGDG